MTDFELLFICEAFCYSRVPRNTHSVVKTRKAVRGNVCRRRQCEKVCWIILAQIVRYTAPGPFHRYIFAEFQDGSSAANMAVGEEAMICNAVPSRLCKYIFAELQDESSAANMAVAEEALP